jgi:hypothetical protein
MNYTGIGSRQTPKKVLLEMEEIAKFLANKGLTLRSGGADGADKAFETGCDKANGKKEIYLPWKGFNNNKSELYIQTRKAYQSIEKFHPAPERLSQGARKIMARNYLQIMGIDETETSFVICWTEQGEKGGTGQAMRIAKSKNIPIINLRTNTMKTAIEKIKKIIIQQQTKGELK